VCACVCVCVRACVCMRPHIFACLCKHDACVQGSVKSLIICKHKMHICVCLRFQPDYVCAHVCVYVRDTSGSMCMFL